MKAITVKETIKTLFPIKRTICIEGSPGGGKTSIVHQAAKEMGIACRELHMPTMLVEDFGILYPKNDSDILSYKIPYWFPDAENPDTPSMGILLFDDRNQASADLQKVLANICQSRTLHGHKLHDGWMIVSTGNYTTDRAGANRILTHLRNRETVISLDTDVNVWSSWAMNNNVKQEVISFINFRPELLHKFDPDAPQNPSPRSWTEGVSAIMELVPENAQFECFKGSVGEGAALEFVGYLKMYQKLPNLEIIDKDPNSVKVVEDLSEKYAICIALAHRATVDNCKNHIEYIKNFQDEFMVLYIKYAYSKNKKLKNVEEFSDMVHKHRDAIFGI